MEEAAQQAGGWPIKDDTCSYGHLKVTHKELVHEGVGEVVVVVVLPDHAEKAVIRLARFVRKEAK